MDRRARLARTAVALALVAGLAGLSPAAAELALPRHGGGEPLTEAQLSRGMVIVVVWVTWSPRGGDIVERMNRIEERWGDRASVVSVVFQEEPERVERFLAGKKLDVPVYLDAGNAEFSKRHNVTRVPWLLVLSNGVTRFGAPLPDDADAVIAGAAG